MAEAEKIAPPNDREMSIWDHLEELRWVVFRAVIGIVLGVIICAIFGEWIIAKVLIAPTERTTPPMHMTNTEVFGQLSLYMQVAMWGGVILSFPYTLIQIWKFVAPGLHQHEKKYVSQITIYTVFSFIAGMAFAYFVMLPMVLDFAAGFVLGHVDNLIEIHKYLAIFMEVVIISGLVFELPLVSYFLSRMKILTPPFLRHYRRHAIVVLLFIAAILSPGGNPLLQLVLFFPLWALFEISVGTSALAVRHARKSAEAKAGATDSLGS